MNRSKGFIAFGPKDGDVQEQYALSPASIKQATPFRRASMLYTPLMEPIKFRPWQQCIPTIHHRHNGPGRSK